MSCCGNKAEPAPVPDYMEMDLEAKYQHLCHTHSDIDDALPVLRRFASECSHVTEFGIRTAVSTTALLAAQPDVLISYDLELNHHFLDNLARFKGRTNFQYRQGDTRLIDIEPTDLLFIDTVHQYRQMKVELARHSSKVRKYLACHDTNIYRFTDEGETDTAIKGIWPAIEEWFNREPWEMCFEFPHRSGFTMFKRK